MAVGALQWRIFESMLGVEENKNCKLISSKQAFLQNNLTITIKFCTSFPMQKRRTISTLNRKWRPGARYAVGLNFLSTYSNKKYFNELNLIQMLSNLSNISTNNQTERNYGKSCKNKSKIEGFWHSMSLFHLLPWDENRALKNKQIKNSKLTAGLLNSTSLMRNIYQWEKGAIHNPSGIIPGHLFVMIAKLFVRIVDNRWYKNISNMFVP